MTAVRDRVRTIDAFAPAKLNLFLHVLGRRADGYHLLESLMVMLDFGDRLRLSLRDDGAVVRSAGSEVVPADEDLAIRAARLLQRRTGCRLGVAIAIDKRIPLGAGLGGGSSDAAAVLLALNRLWALELDRATLGAIGLELGADVPFFVFGESALASGVGDRLAAVTVPPAWFVVLTPPVHVPTASIFASPKLTRDTASARIPLFPEGFGRNDLQRVAIESFPDVARHLAALGRLAPARMTGSGACVFAAFPCEASARTALGTVGSGFAGFVARLLPRHPLQRFAGERGEPEDAIDSPLGSRQAG